MRVSSGLTRILLSLDQTYQAKCQKFKEVSSHNVQLEDMLQKLESRNTELEHTYHELVGFQVSAEV